MIKNKDKGKEQTSKFFKTYDLFYVSLDKAITWKEYRNKITSTTFKTIEALEKNTPITKLFGDIMLILASRIKNKKLIKQKSNSLVKVVNHFMI